MSHSDSFANWISRSKTTPQCHTSLSSAIQWSIWRSFSILNIKKHNFKTRAAVKTQISHTHQTDASWYDPIFNFHLNFFQLSISSFFQITKNLFKNCFFLFLLSTSLICVLHFLSFFFSMSSSCVLVFSIRKRLYSIEAADVGLFFNLLTFNWILGFDPSHFHLCAYKNKKQQNIWIFLRKKEIGHIFFIMNEQSIYYYYYYIHLYILYTSFDRDRVWYNLVINYFEMSFLFLFVFPFSQFACQWTRLENIGCL